MTTQTESAATRLHQRVQTRRSQLRALRRRGGLIALGLAGIAYDQSRARLVETIAWLEDVVQRGEQTEQDLRDARHAARARVEEVLQEVQTRGEAVKAEARVALRRFVASPDPVQEDIPIETDSPIQTTESTSTV